MGDKGILKSVVSRSVEFPSTGVCSVSPAWLVLGSALAGTPQKRSVIRRRAMAVCFTVGDLRVDHVVQVQIFLFVISNL